MIIMMMTTMMMMIVMIQNKMNTSRLLVMMEKRGFEKNAWKALSNTSSISFHNKN